MSHLAWSFAWGIGAANPLAGALFFLEAINNFFRNDAAKLPDVAAEHDDLADEAAAGEGELVAGHDEDGFDPADRPVGHGELEFVAHVGGVAQAAQNGLRLLLPHHVHSQAVIANDAGAGHVGDEIADHLDALVEAEHLTLIRVDAHGHDQFIEQRHAATDDVEMAIGNRVELARKDGSADAGRHGTAVLPRAAGICEGHLRPGNLPGVLERVTFDNGVIAYVSPLLRAAGVPHAFSSRLGGVSEGPFASLNLGNPGGCPQQDSGDNITENYRRLQSAIGCGGRRRVFTHQMHGPLVVDAATAAQTDVMYGGSEIGKGDGIFSRDPALLLSVRTADCVPVLLASADGRTVAAVHAGWRGVIAGVATAALRLFDQPAGVIAAIGPGIGFNAFEVGEDVVGKFEEAFGDFPGASSLVRRVGDGKGRVDLKSAIAFQLRRAGVLSIDTTERCTATHGEEFFSHRRDASVTGRMAAVIGAVAR